MSIIVPKGKTLTKNDKKTEKKEGDQKPRSLVYWFVFISAIV